jgi:acyl CoA:acetate/3-ketoacid CoA transferase
MDFTPLMPDELVTMDPRIFTDAPMDLLARFSD